MGKEFDHDQAKKFLEKREKDEDEKREVERVAVFNRAVNSLKELFSETNVAVYLVGSVIQPYRFHSRSDVDVVLKNYVGDRFEIWTKLEEMIQRDVEIILFEHSTFQEHVIKHGFKVL